MKEKVIRSFIDKETKKPYNAGSVYESDNQERIQSLKDGGFLYKNPEPGDDGGDEKGEEFPKDVGGGWYELSSGKKIQGEEKAIAAQEELDKEG